jgi:hypothetical protein
LETPPASPPTDVHLAATDNRYTPPTLTVAVGTKVVWDFQGANTHTATDSSPLGLFSSGNRAGGTSFGYRYTGAGTYTFRCTNHQKMTGSVSVPVTASATTGSTSSQITRVVEPQHGAVDLRHRRAGAAARHEEVGYVEVGHAARVGGLHAGRRNGHLSVPGAAAQAVDRKSSAWSPAVTIEIS